MDNACGKCESCETGNEQYCHAGFTVTYNSPIDDPVGFTYGGYSQRIVADESFVLKMPANLELTGTDPLLCTGITTYSTLQYWSVTKGMDVGLGGPWETWSHGSQFCSFHRSPHGHDYHYS